MYIFKLKLGEKARGCCMYVFLVYSEVFSHVSGMKNISKLNPVYAKLQQFFVLNTRLYEELSLFHFVSSRALYSKLNCKCDII